MLSEQPSFTQEWITDLADDAYRLLSPIKIIYQRSGSGFTASFVDANIAISGITKQDAREALLVEILDAFDDWAANESALGVGLTQQLAVLRRYIARC